MNGDHCKYRGAWILCGRATALPLPYQYWVKIVSYTFFSNEKKGKKKILFFITGGGRIRDVASLIRRTDEPEIKKIFWGEKSKKTFSMGVQST